MTDLAALADPLALPPFADLTPERIVPAVRAAIAQAEAVVARLVAERPATFADAWLPYERVDTATEALWSAVSHLHGVADTPALRAAHGEGQALLVEHAMRVAQDRALYDVFVALEGTPGFAALPVADRVAVERALRGFRLAGVALDEDARARFAAVSVELSQLSTEFGSAVLDATEAWGETVAEAALVGVSDADRAMFRAAAEAKGEEGYRVTLHQPSVQAVLTFAENRDLRARVYAAHATRASDGGPDAGRFDNGPRIARILALRREAAGLLGFPDPVAWSLETKMAPDAGEVLAFLRDLAELRAFAAAELGIGELQPWDLAFAADRLRRARYAVDEQAVRGYFPVERVVAGWQALLARLYGLRLREREDVALYHPDARFFDVTDAAGEVIAGLYLDLHARDGKRGGAWMADARPRLADGNAVRVPVAYLVCNFAPRGEGAPSLLSHGDVTTLLHETGHCLHHLLTRVDRPSIAGVSGFEWDAVELPSQLMEDFAWDQGVLTAMSGHHATGEPLPGDLYDRMLAARRFQSGLFILRQVEFALFDVLLHLGTLGDDPMAVLGAVRDEVAVVRPPDWTRFPHAFGHIFAGGYAAGYYSYLWAEVLAADGFALFAEAGPVDRATGDRFRDEVLARGATRPAAESFRAFRGRDPDPAAMLDRHGLAGADA